MKAKVGAILFIKNPNVTEAHRHIFLGKYLAYYYFLVITSTDKNRDYFPYIKLEKANYRTILKHDSYVGCSRFAVFSPYQKPSIESNKLLGYIVEKDMLKILRMIQDNLPDIYNAIFQQYKDKEEIDI